MNLNLLKAISSGRVHMNVNFCNTGLLAAFCFSSVVNAANVSTNDLYKQYQDKPNHKAFSIGTNGSAGAAWGASTKEEAMDLAQQTCEDSGGVNCNITEVNGRPLASSDMQVKNYRTVNNYNIVSNGVNYKPNPEIKATAFFVNNQYLVSVGNIIDKCSKLSYERNGRLIDLTVIRTDKMNNLSLLKTSSTNESYATVSSKKKTYQGERTYSYGYDLSDINNFKTPSYQGKITDGIISRASGKYNDIRFMRITNEINAGNVGGPVIAENGDVIGIVTNTNKESIKASILSIFLNEQNISYHVTKSQNSIPPSAIAEKSQNFTVPLVCLNEA
ncbi:trypsin-like peptidase domain-containing protein [Photobacterium alginatilyticum]|uniref:trypsin-like peptidase domain-containing protein n=1 Tax=Photobacterium alginatilyticum TaxID=1775171 RepID=UPI0040681763